MKIGNKILELRKKNNLSQEQLGEKINVTRQTISNWELGETTPNSEQLIELADIFEISVDELIGHRTPNKKSNKEQILLIAIIILSILLVITILLLINKPKEPINENPTEKTLNTTTMVTTSKPKIDDTFVRTYKVLKLEKVDCKGKNGCDDTTYLIELEQCKKDIEEFHISNVKDIKNVEIGKTYEFTFNPNVGEVYYEDKIINIFAFNKVTSIKETTKKCSNQRQDQIKTRSN